MKTTVSQKKNQFKLSIGLVSSELYKEQQRRKTWKRFLMIKRNFPFWVYPQPKRAEIQIRKWRKEQIANIKESTRKIDRCKKELKLLMKLN